MWMSPPSAAINPTPPKDDPGAGNRDVEEASDQDSSGEPEERGSSDGFSRVRQASVLGGRRTQSRLYGTAGTGGGLLEKVAAGHPSRSHSAGDD